MKYTIEEVLPHKKPMILIDEINNYSNGKATCTVTISDSSPFYNPEKQGVPSYIGCEYMAQAIAAFAGAKALDNNENVKIGFLLGSRKYKTHQPYFHLNSKLNIHVDELYNETSGLSVFDCIIASEDNPLVEAKINVFQPSNPESFLEQQSKDI